MKTAFSAKTSVNVAAKVGLWLLLIAACGVAVAAILRLVSTVGYAITGVTTVTLPGLGFSRTDPSGPSVLGPKVQQVLHGGNIDLVLHDLPGGALVLNTAAAILGQLTTLLVCAAVIMLCWRLLRGVPFAPTLTRSISIMGGVLVLIGVVVPILQGFSKLLIVESLDNVLTVESPLGKGNLDYYIVFSVDLLPVVLGIALLLLAAVFAKGAQLQRDTEGLV
ncbi:hypothetical protein CQ020_01850 [Arthrobacter sp. MYb23]|uniref:hypothetical protein n=1 Tax=unclassified Arthrobacter TaxID=235627 RepID=UPI000CFA865B|nr:MULTISPECIES: hypothetical protein [unclassified Arthrobacter]PRB44986.1 hypothetical protein CQ038_00930 [Arthrobacter sp. MYb51]PRB99551.1 hypothetical protein CQ020_01850 [Arthrobacter sp. MYb23]